LIETFLLFGASVFLGVNKIAGTQHDFNCIASELFLSSQKLTYGTNVFRVEHLGNTPVEVALRVNDFVRLLFAVD
jgi:hypothetical protein